MSLLASGPCSSAQFSRSSEPIEPAVCSRSCRKPAQTCHAVGRSISSTSAAFASGRALHAARQSLQKPARGSSLVVRAERDFYNILGVQKGADKKAIKSAYRQKARKFHPDVNKDPNAEALFKDISAAYEVLSDDDKRAIYDRYGEAGLKQGAFGGGGNPNVDFSNPFDIFESFFGGGMGGGGMGGFGGMGGQRRRNGPVQGEDERHDLQLNFLDAVFGANCEIEVTRLAACGTCNGSGVKAGTNPQTCTRCGGAGQVVEAVRTPLGMFQQVSTCSQCSGTGEQFTPCTKCSGEGRVRETKRISLRVPAGVDDGSRLRVRGEGNSGRRGGESGDLYVFIRVKEHPELRRDGTTIHSDVEIPYVDAILGTTVSVTTVDGKVDLKIPAGTQPGTTLVMQKRGVPKLGSTSSRGDHMVHVKVKIPKSLSADERKLVEQLKEMQNSKAASRWF